MNVAIIGLARSGYAAARLARHLGYQVRVSDARVPAHHSADGEAALEKHAAELRAMGVWVELGAHTPACVEGADVVVISPGVSDKAQPVAWARAASIPVISEIEFAVRHTTARIVGITGTNGKTTTTALVAHMLNHAGVHAIAAGNIGQALSGVVEHANGHQTLVIEISSFQLETVQSFHPHVAIWLNLTPDHLDRYETMERYAAAKGRMFMNMTPDDWALVWLPDRKIVEPFLARCGARAVWIDEKGTWTPSPREPYGAVCRDGRLYTVFNGIETMHAAVDDTQLIGPHNSVNMLAACAAARALHVPNHLLCEGLRSFRPLPHRLEVVARQNGITYVNDSKATNVDAMQQALHTIQPPVALIAGGHDKGMDFRPYAPLVRERVQRLVLMGAAAQKLREQFDGVADTVVARSMREAVELAARAMPHGSTVLLSPGCASFDLYNDFEHRGNDFKECVHRYLMSQT
ncbi:UDP-N-acetylmuramoyl-L-alanine--D-glutamate ligase [bacterium]|nr:UDP-N-acetylmuramoyl-L-alanine--D-glutamate ligase [bacterium]